MTKWLITFCLVLFAACARVDVEGAPEGEFRGTALVVWVGSGGSSGSGDGTFVYVPLENNELTFVRSDAANASDGNEVITPGAFYTDGGSIPRGVQWVQGFNAWAFGPAYIIHDWLFVVRKCVNTGDPWGTGSPIAKMSFAESARIMAETIKTVTSQYGLRRETGEAVNVIAPVTAGPVSYGLWTEENACKNPEKDERLRKIVAQVNLEERQGLLPRASGIGTDMLRLEARDGRARPIVVAEIGLPPPAPRMSPEG